MLDASFRRPFISSFFRLTATMTWVCDSWSDIHDPVIGAVSLTKRIGMMHESLHLAFIYKTVKGIILLNMSIMTESGNNLHAVHIGVVQRPAYPGPRAKEVSQLARVGMISALIFLVISTK